MKGKPDINTFLEGAEAKQQPSQVSAPKAATAPPSRITKTIRLATDLDAALKVAAHERWKTTGKRVAESDIIDEALRQYLNTSIS